VADLDAREQLFLELVNRARMDPLGEAARYGLANLNSGLAAGTISSAPKQVLAGNAILEVSASLHSQDMIDRDYFAHETLGSNASPGTRMANAGYGAAGSFGWGENLAWTGSTGSYNADAEVYAQHRNLFLSAGHRTNILNGNYEEVGIGSVTGNFQGYNAMMTAENFAYDGATDNFITGVSYNDANNDDFYSIGEGKGGRTVYVYSGNTLLGSSTTTAAGGYSVETTQTGTIEVVFSGGDLAANYGVTVALGSSNVKVDLVDNNTIETNFSATLTESSTGLRLLGVDNVSGTGNGLDNTLWGNKGDNRLTGSDGSDTIAGGAGNDTAVYAGSRASYVVSYSSGTQTFNISGDNGAIDHVTGVEFFEFADGTLTAAEMQSGASLLRTVAVAADKASLTEGNTGSQIVHFTISLSGTVSSEQSVHYVIAGSGANPSNGDDISAVFEDTVVFAAGETTKVIAVEVFGDKTFEANEAFTITLSSATSGLSIGTGGASVSIVNDDVPPVMWNGTSGDNTLNGSAKVDEIHGLDGNDKLSGGAGDDALFGDNGIDSLNGGAGADEMQGGADNDTYVVDNMNDLVDETDGSGVETVLSSISFSLAGPNVAGDVENLTLTGRGSTSATGNDLANVITGNRAANVLSGAGGNDWLDGAGGADIMAGGTGDDTYVVNSAGDVVIEAGGDGIDTLLTSVSFNLSDGVHAFGDIENVILLGSGRINATGNALGNTLTGNAGSNILSGLDGNDTLNGAAGNDTLSGGTGDDTLTGGAGSDRFVFGAAGFGHDTVTDFVDGADKLQFAKASVADISGLAITGNGTLEVEITVGGDSIILHGLAPITITAADLLFV
jgi:Ca2+-binding RTX toxin-like protein